jgi:hypothetical protein
LPAGEARRMAASPLALRSNDFSLNSVANMPRESPANCRPDALPRLRPVLP